MANRFRFKRVDIEHSKADKPQMIWIRYPVNGRMVPAQVLKRGTFFLRVAISGTDLIFTLTRRNQTGTFSFENREFWIESNGVEIKM